MGGFPDPGSELAGIYGRFDEPRPYTVGTSRNTKRDGAWRRVVVRVNRPNAVQRTKQGYFAPTR